MHARLLDLDAGDDIVAQLHRGLDNARGVVLVTRPDQLPFRSLAIADPPGQDARTDTQALGCACESDDPDHVVELRTNLGQRDEWTLSRLDAGAEFALSAPDASAPVEPELLLARLV